MKTLNLVCGIFALLGVIVFLGKYAVSIGEIPLWIIIVGVLVLPVADLIVTLRHDLSGDGNGGSG